MSAAILPRYAEYLIRLRTQRLRPERMTVYLDDDVPQYQPGPLALKFRVSDTAVREAMESARRGTAWTEEQFLARVDELAKEPRFVESARYEWWCWLPELAITPEMPIGKLDLRSCTGLDLIVTARRAESEPRLDELLERLKHFGAREVHAARLWLANDDERCVQLEITAGSFV